MGESPRVRAALPELPKGGGAVRGVGEKFSTSAVTGTGAVEIPIPTAPSRGFQPELTLGYDSGAGNGPFGAGWQLPVPRIARKTEQQLPRYIDADETDTFVISDAEDLVPALDPTGRRVEGKRGTETYRRYRPRLEGAFARIEQRTTSDGNVYWVSVTPGNVTHTFGRSNDARIVDPAHPERVFSWLLERSENALGDVITYSYRREDTAGVPAAPAELRRLAGEVGIANQYLRRIRYGNTRPGDVDSCVFDVVFDYGDHDALVPRIEPTPGETWPSRLDPFSIYRAGFDIRTYRLCRRILMFHTLPELGETPCLVSSMRFGYAENPVLTKLRTAEYAGHTRAGDGAPYETLAAPPMELGYAPVIIHDEVRVIDHGTAGDLPGGIDGKRDRWIDLDGEGIPGVISDEGDALVYRRNLGAGALGPPRLLATRPALGLGGQQLMDLGGDGALDLVSFGATQTGFYERIPPSASAPDGDWEGFRTFRYCPNIPFDDPGLHFLDLDGDGLDDVLLVTDDVFVWYPSLGKDGFGAPRTLPRPSDEELGPAIIFSDGDQTILVADLDGDGLRDLARVRNGHICYWPNLGHGRFGAMVTMANPPVFDAPDQFDPARILFADIDGSGTTDLLYHGRAGVRFWFNHSGNGWGPMQELPDLPPVTDEVTLAAVDVLGAGTCCLVWSTPLPAPPGARTSYVDLLGGVKPHLLTSVDNHLGGTTRIQYAPSTRFYLADRAAGTPWLTRLPFPVHVVERVETYDDVRRVRFVSEYSYHEGYYDGDEREFRGFGRVVQRDTESDPPLAGRGLFADRPPPVNGELPQPPAVTTTWFHTGVWLDDARTPSGLGNRLPSGLSPAESRDAYRALKGLQLRQEVRAEDGSAAAALPYFISEHTYAVERLQPSDGDEVAVFAAHPLETLVRHTERDLDDARVQHAFTIEIDEVGHVRRAIELAYARGPGTADDPRRPEQQRPLATMTETDVANVLDGFDWYRHGEPLESRTYELGGLPLLAPGALLDFDSAVALASAAVAIGYDSAVPPGPSKRLVGRSRVRYYDSEHLPALVPSDTIDARAITCETYALAFTPSLLASLYGDRVDETLLRDGGYVLVDGEWWLPSGRSIPDASKFYLPTQYFDSFGNPPTLVEYDPYLLAVVAITDPKQNQTRTELDYRTVQPREVTDENGCQQRVATDALGRVIALWNMGNPDRVEGDRDPASPTVVMDYAFYDAATGRPSVVHQQARETHGDPASKWQHAYTYSDGSGQEVMTKAQAEPARETPTVARWTCTGRTIFDNKGNAIRQYEPFFSATSDWDEDEALATVGVSSVMHYDPLSRLILTERPDGSTTRADFTPWRQDVWDANDTLGDTGNLWLARAQASPDPALRRAAALALDHAGTKTVSHFDPLGRVIAVVADNKTETLETRSSLDIEGNVLVAWDALERACMTRSFNILGLSCLEIGIDAGIKRSLVDAAGEPLRHWDRIDDTHDRVVRVVYDELRRPVELHAKTGDADELLVEKAVWGEDAPVDASANRRARIYQIFDGAGVVTRAEYDFAGRLRVATRQLCEDYTATPDWGAMPPPKLEDEVFTTRRELDALDRVIRAEAPDGSVTWPAYNAASLLDRVEVQLRGAQERTMFVAGIDYDAKGQRTRILYGAANAPAATTEYQYDELTFRLAAMTTTRATGLLQDLAYTYDPVGNIAQLTDANQDPVWWDGHVVDGTARYWYQPTYRLQRADAREHARGLAARRDNQDIPLAPLPHPNDEQKLIPYSEVYEYDKAGNITSISHGPPSAGAAWISPMHYAGSNRLLATMVTGDDRQDPDTWHGRYTYDSFGNMTSMPHLARVDWDWADRMQRADKGGGGAVYFTYDASGDRVRKVWEHGGTIDERIYLGGYEIYRRRVGDRLDLERQTLHVMDDTRRIALVETKTADRDNPQAAPIARIRYQLANHLGSVALEIDQIGNVISYEEFHPYGTSAYRSASSADVSEKRYRYGGKERDSETGLNYHGARYYAAWLGRWTSADPTGLADGPNAYQFARQNPIRYVDNDGTTADPFTLATDPEILEFWHQAVDEVLKEGRYKNLSPSEKIKRFEKWIEQVERRWGKGSNTKPGSIRAGRRTYNKVRSAFEAIMAKKGRAIPSEFQLHHYLKVSKFPKRALNPHSLGPVIGHAGQPGTQHNLLHQPKMEARMEKKFLKKLADVEAKEAAAAGKVAGKGSKLAGKAGKLAGAASKAAGKLALGIGVGFALKSAYDNFQQGDALGGTLDLLGLIPGPVGIGFTIIGLGYDIYKIKKEMDQEAAPPPPPAPAPAPEPEPEPEAPPEEPAPAPPPPPKKGPMRKAPDLPPEQRPPPLPNPNKSGPGFNCA